MHRGAVYKFKVVGVLLVLFLAGCGEKSGTAVEAEFEIDKQYSRGPLTAVVRISKTELTIAQTLVLELQASIESGYEVSMPKVDKMLENFGIRQWRNLGDRLDENNNVVTTYRYQLEPFLSGSFAIPAFTFEFRKIPQSPDDEQKLHVLETEPIDVEVKSLLSEQRGKLVIADIEGVVQMHREAAWWPIVIIIAAVGIVVVFIILRARRSRAKVSARIFRPAHEVAYKRLEALIGAGLVEAGKVKEFYERISNILRHYIEDRFDLRAPERTTEEFLFELQYTDELSNDDKDGLSKFMVHCDLVKFARHKPEPAQIQKTFDLVKNFIEKTKSQQRQIDVTEMVKAEVKAQGRVA